MCLSPIMKPADHAKLPSVSDTDVAAFHCLNAESFCIRPACCLNYAEPGIATGQNNMPLQQVLRNIT